MNASGATIVAEDSGERVPCSLRETLLDPTRQLRSGAAKGGTGLILMSRLAQIHRGRASVDGLPHGGAAFKVFRPAVPDGAPHAPGQVGDDGARSTLEDGAIAIERL